MAMESTLQVRMDSSLKAEVEALYKSLGTSFAEAVRIFAQQSSRKTPGDHMPPGAFCPVEDICVGYAARAQRVLKMRDDDVLPYDL